MGSSGTNVMGRSRTNVMGRSGTSSGAPGAGRIGHHIGRLWLRGGSALDRSLLRGLDRTGGETRTDAEIIIIDKMTMIMTTDTDLLKTSPMTYCAGVSLYRVSTSSKEVLL